MFDKEAFRKVVAMPSFIVKQASAHDLTIRSCVTGHDWVILSFYDSPRCILYHRHNARYPFHQQKGRYKSLEEAVSYIKGHEAYTKALQDKKAHKHRK